jgi:anthranilate synthase component II
MIHVIRHKTRALHGVQFHPESICTESGADLLRNFRNLTMAHNKEMAA